MRRGTGTPVSSGSGTPDGDERAGADRVPAVARHGKVGIVDGHGSVSPVEARGTAPRPHEPPGGRPPRTPEAGPRVHAVRNAGGAARAGRGAERPLPGSKGRTLRANRGGERRLWSVGHAGRSENATRQGEIG